MLFKFWPQLFVLFFSVIALGRDFAKHNEKKVSSYNGWYGLIAFGIVMYVYYCGGFFDGMIK